MSSNQSDVFRDSLPEDWEKVPLAEVVPHAEYGVSVSLNDDHGVPVLRMNNLKDGEVDLTDLKMSASPQAAKLLLKPLDVLFNRTNSWEHVGRTGIWRGQLKRASFASYLVRLVPDQERLVPEYLNRWLNSRSTQIDIRRYATPGVSQVNINPTNLRKARIALPTPPEQRRIAAILDAADAAIQHTATLIDKLQRMKQGLLHDLLTRGLNDNGELRDPVSHPEQFQDSPLGRIPKVWKTECLQEIVTPDAPICYGIVQPGPFNSHGVPVVAIYNLGGDYSTDIHRSATNIECRYSRSRIRPGDVLLSIKGSIGRSDVVPGGFRGNITRDVCRIRLRSGISPNYIRLALDDSYTQQRLKAVSVGTTRAELSIWILKEFKLPIPSPLEQKGIAAAVLKHENRIRAEQARLAKLKRLKEGLMRDLLTGRKRVLPEAKTETIDA